jgi:hypothetical protein
MSKVMCFVVLLMAAGTAFAANVYVDLNAVGANTGTSWIDAYTNLQSALPGNSGDIIYVAFGTYTPAGAGGSAAATFAPGAGVTLSGGWDAKAVRFTYAYGPGMINGPFRSPGTTPTILSGDLNGDDTAVADLYVKYDALNSGTTNRAENSDIVVTIGNPNVTIDGFYIVKGDSTGSGAGMSVSGNNLTVKNCVFELNACSTGAALYFGSVTGALVQDTLFTQNEGCRGSQPLGIALQQGTNSVTYRNVTFTENSSFGGDNCGIYVQEGGNAYIYDSVFTRNVSCNGGRQGPLTSRSGNQIALPGSHMEVYNSMITDNINGPGGGNGIPGGGGAVTVHGPTDLTSPKATLVIHGCLIANNSCWRADLPGSPNQGSNRGRMSGEGISIRVGADADIVNCTVVGGTMDINNNRALTQMETGCGIALMDHDSSGVLSQPPTAHIESCIVWGNMLADIQKDPTAVVNLEYTDVQNDDPNCYTTGVGVITTDPQFVVGDLKYNVQATSPTIDTGDPDSDWSKEPKCNGERINMGWTGGTGMATPKVSVARVLDGDVNCDGTVNLADFSKLASEWLQ